MPMGMKFSLQFCEPLLELMTSVIFRRSHRLLRFLGGKTNAFSLALIFLLGLSAAFLCRKIGLPRILGMLLVGIALGPYALNLLSGEILSVSAPLRQMALIIILIKAGLSLDIADLKKVGRPALLMSFVL